MATATTTDKLSSEISHVLFRREDGWTPSKAARWLETRGVAKRYTDYFEDMQSGGGKNLAAGSYLVFRLVPKDAGFSSYGYSNELRNYPGIWFKYGGHRPRARDGASEHAADASVPDWWSDQHDQAYNALQAAGSRIGQAEYAAGRYNVKRNRKGQVTRGYTISSAHKEVIDALDALTRNRISPEEAMSVLHGYDVFKSRTSAPPLLGEVTPAIKEIHVFEAAHKPIKSCRDAERLADYIGEGWEDLDVVAIFTTGDTAIVTLGEAVPSLCAKRLSDHLGPKGQYWLEFVVNNERRKSGPWRTEAQLRQLAANLTDRGFNVTRGFESSGDQEVEVL